MTEFSTKVYENDTYVSPIVLDEVVDERGVTLRHVRVKDISEQSPTREAMQDRIAAYDKYLVENPDLLPPQSGDDGQLFDLNVVSAEIYDSPGMRDWRRELVPNAEALIPMQRPDITNLPLYRVFSRAGEIVDIKGGQEVDEVARSFYTDALDSIGIRTRAAVMSDTARRYVQPGEHSKWVSLACGAALPVLEALKVVSRNGADAHLTLVDYNQGTLLTAQEMAEGGGLVEGDQFSIKNRNLVTDMIISDKFVQEYGEESAAMVDALGIFEYFNDERSAAFLHNSYRLVKPGGALVIANMLSSRPELDFNQRGIGWPKIYPRSIKEIIDIVAAAGIDTGAVTVTIPEDGVYGVVEIKK